MTTHIAITETHEPAFPSGAKFDAPAEECTGFDYVTGPNPNNDDDDNFEGWFPLGEVSLIFGSTGSGKTTWGIQLLRSQEIGAPFFGHKTFKLPWVMLMKDRSRQAAKRTFRRMKLDPATLPLRKWPEGRADVVRQVELVYQREVKKPRIIFVEGLDLMVPKGKEMDSWVPVLEGLAAVAERYNLAVICTVGSPKQKGKDRYEAHRDSAFGSQVVGRMCETMCHVQECYDTGDRRITIMPTNAPSETMELGIRHGVLTVIEALSFTAAKAMKPLVLKRQQFGEWWSPEATLDQARGTFGKDFAKSTFHKWSGECREALESVAVTVGQGSQKRSTDSLVELAVDSPS